MKFRSLLLAAALLFSCPALAGISSLNNAQLIITPPTTAATLIGLTGCQDFSQIIDSSAGIEYIIQDCAGTYQLQQFWPPVASTIQGLNTAAVPESGSNIYFTNARVISAATAAGFITAASAPVQSVNGLTGAVTLTIPSAQVNTDWNATSGVTQLLHKPTAVSAFTNDAGYLIPSGSSSQYLDGTGAARNFTSASWTYQNGSHALASCFQVSSTQDTNFTYSVDITAGILTLGGGTGTVTAYTNSGCTTGARVIGSGAVSSVALSGTSTIPMTAWLPAGQWAKVTGTATGGSTATIDSTQPEALKP